MPLQTSLLNKTILNNKRWQQKFTQIKHNKKRQKQQRTKLRNLGENLVAGSVGQNLLKQDY